MNISNFIPPIVINGFKKLIKLNRSKYQVGKYVIDIPANLALPDLQKNFKLYDRFLPVLARHINSGQCIIDVGANIGDTAIALLQECNNPIVCIEPSDIFYPYLEKNFKKLSPEDLMRVKAIKSFVGTGRLQGQLIHTDAGTASIVISERSQEITHIPLDELIEDSSDVILIKVDVDGYDFDVIRSAEKILTDSNPILFWENQIDEDFQNRGFEELYKLLSDMGYTYIYLFDNFGNLITEEHNFNTLRNLNSYIASMKLKYSAKTIFYTDVLATTEKYNPQVRKAIDEYKRDWINK